MSNPVVQIISDITATGARFILDADGVGLDRIIPDGLLELARQNKHEIRRELESQQAAIRDEGLKRLKSAAQGLPVSFQELSSFFAGDLQSFGIGEVKQAGIRKACEWFAYVYPAWRAQQ